MRAIGLHIEGLQDIERFQKGCLMALERKVPIVAIKTGSSTIGNNLVNSHTGSLSGTDGIYNALFDHLGIIRVTNPHEFLETLKCFLISNLQLDNTESRPNSFVFVFAIILSATSF